MRRIVGMFGGFDILHFKVSINTYSGKLLECGKPNAWTADIIAAVAAEVEICSCPRTILFKTLIKHPIAPASFPIQ